MVITVDGIGTIPSPFEGLIKSNQSFKDRTHAVLLALTYTDVKIGEEDFSQNFKK